MQNWTPWHRHSERRRRDHDAPPVALAVLGAGAGGRVLPDRACDARLVTTGLAELEAELSRHCPRFVVAQAISAGFDALDVGMRLAALRFDGQFLVMTGEVPCGAMIRAEIEAACPGLRVDVLSAPAQGAALVRAV